jgi:dCMP deaminase
MSSWIREDLRMTGVVVRLPDVDTYYMGIAVAVQAKANCLGSRVGAVMVLQNRVISTGYNGVPEGMTNCLDQGCLRGRNRDRQFKPGTGYDLCICVHAEQNALLTAARFGIAVEGATVYTTMRPCFGCGKELLQAKVKRVVYRDLWTPPDSDPDMARQKLEEYTRLLAQFAEMTQWHASQ